MKGALDSEEFDFADDCRALLAGEKLRWSNITLWLIVLFIAGGIYWASKAELDEVTRGNGKVIPSSAQQVVQSLEGGIIEEILVKQGDEVQPGQVLLRLSDTLFAATYRENLARRDVLEARTARFKAEAQGAAAITFSERLSRERPDLVASEQELFEQRQRDLSEDIQAAQRSLDLAQKEMDMTRPLLKTGAASEIEVMRLEREINELGSTVANLLREFRKESLQSYDLGRGELEGLREAITADEDKVARTVLKSTIHGIVKDIHINSVGRVVQGGDPIMEIVPIEDNLLVQADILPADIAFLHPGQKAVVKFTAYDFTIFGGLDGVVEQISADTIANERGESFYQVKVRTEQSVLPHKGEDLPIIPGMIVQLDILTGKKTILDYLLKPINRAKGRALRER